MSQPEATIRNISHSIHSKILNIGGALDIEMNPTDTTNQNSFTGGKDKSAIHKMTIMPNPDQLGDQSFIGFENIPSHIHSLVLVSPDKHLSVLGTPNDTQTVFPFIHNLTIDGHRFEKIEDNDFQRFPNMESLELINGQDHPMNVSIPFGHPIRTLGLRKSNIATINIANAPNLEVLDITELLEPVKIGLTKGQRGSVHIIGGDKTKYELIEPNGVGGEIKRQVKEEFIENVIENDETNLSGGGPKKKVVIKQTVNIKEEVVFPWVPDAIAKYYELKKTYDSTCQIIKKRTIEALKKKNKKVTKAMISQIKYKCLYCSRDVGSVFERTEDSLVAYCGDKTNPCEFKIDIYRGLVYNMNKYRAIFKRDIEEAKENIMKTKMDNLFGYVTEKESVRTFKENMEVYTVLEEQLNELNARYKALSSTPEKEAIIMKLIGQINECLKEVRDLIQQYKTNGNERILQFAIDKHVSILKPKIEQLREVRYDVKHMNQIGEKSYLVQYRYKFDELDPVVDRTAEGRVKAFRIKS